MKSTALLILLCVILWAPAGLGEECTDFADAAHYDRFLPDLPAFSEFTYGQGHLWGVTYEGEFTVCDLTDPDHPSILASLQLPRHVSDIQVQENLALVSFYSADLHILDISNPRQPAILSTLATPGENHGMVLMDDIAWIGDYEAGLLSIDLSSPATPTILGSLHAPLHTVDLAFDDGMIALASWITGLIMVDPSDPAAPAMIGFQQVAHKASGVAMAGGYVFMAEWRFGLEVIDVRDPRQPEPVHTHPILGGATRICLQGNRAFTMGGGLNLSIFDISEPRLPVYLETLSSPGWPLDMAVIADGTEVHISKERPNGIAVFDTREPTSPAIIGSASSSDRAYDVAVQGDFTLLATDAGIKVFDTSDPAAPLLVHSSEGSSTYRVTALGSFALARDGHWGLALFDTSQLPEIRRLGWIRSDLNITDWAQLGHQLFLGSRDGTIYTTDLDFLPETDCQPFMDNQLFGSRVLAFGDLLLVTGREPVLTIVSPRDRCHPSILASFELPHKFKGWACSDTHLFLLEDSLECLVPALVVVDLTDPADPAIVLRDENICNPRAKLTVDGDLLYATGSNFGIQILDISRPERPRIIGQNPIIDASGMQVEGDHLVLAAGVNGLVNAPLQCRVQAPVLEVLMDVKPGDPENHVPCGSHAHGMVPVALLSTADFDALTVDHEAVRFGPAGAMEAHANHHGVIRHETDVDEDGRLDLLFHFRVDETGIQCGDTQVELVGLTFAGTTIRGIDAIQPQPHHQPAEGTVSSNLVPNPFNPRTTLRFEVAEPKEITVSVFDLRGRLVSPLFDGRMPQGPCAVDWDGRDANGQRVPAGTYFFRISFPDRIETHKGLLLK